MRKAKLYLISKKEWCAVKYKILLAIQVLFACRFSPVACGLWPVACGISTSHRPSATSLLVQGDQQRKSAAGSGRRCQRAAQHTVCGRVAGDDGAVGRRRGHRGAAGVH